MKSKISELFDKAFQGQWAHIRIETVTRDGLLVLSDESMRNVFAEETYRSITGRGFDDSTPAPKSFRTTGITPEIGALLAEAINTIMDDREKNEF